MSLIKKLIVYNVGKHVAVKRDFLTSFLGLSQLSPARLKREHELINLAYGT